MTPSRRDTSGWGRRVAFFDPRQVWIHDLTLLKQVESFGGPITLLRVGVVGALLVALQTLQAPSVLIRDFLVYMTVTLVQTLAVTLLPTKIGRWGTALIFATCVGVGLAWTTGLLHLWLQDDSVLRMLGLLGLLWWLIYAVTARRNDPVMMTATLCAMSVAMIALPLTSWLVWGDTREAVLLTLTNAVGFVFYINAVRDVRVMRQTLAQAQDLAVEQSKAEALGRLTGGVAHDFNNLLTVISGNLELIRQIDDPAERQILLDEVAAAAERATRVTGQLLAYSRRAPMHVTRVDVTDLITELEMLLRRILSARITFRTRLQQPLPVVEVDRSQLETVLLNLAINAKDALSQGGSITLVVAREHVQGQIYHTTSGVLPPGDYLRIDVDDDGEGMPPEVLSRAMEPYFTTKPKGRGTGMGLSMARGFAEQSGGALLLRSSQGAGSIATILLPEASPQSGGGSPAT